MLINKQKKMDKINFTVNGERYSLSGSEVSSDTSLNDYIRNHLQLHGTKAMCHEGGCGACVVSVSQIHPATKEKHEFSVNSCLVNVLSCHEWDIKTIEGIGNRRDGYHSIQNRLAAFNGTQCGFCTPGWVMNMYSLTKANKVLTTQEVEDSFGGNLCRCTGYRPILDAFKSFANDTDPELQSKLQDLEDLHITKCSKPCSRKCSITEDWCVIDDSPGTLMQLNAVGGRWYKAYTVQDIFTVLSRESTDDYRLVSGNTGQGVYAISKEPKTLIDISSIETLKLTLSDENLILGAGMSLTDVMKTFRDWSQRKEEFAYLEVFYKHLDLVAHVPVRNIGSIGGNLALKNKHHEFPSDVFIILETVGGTATIVDNKLSKSELKMDEFLKTDLKSKLINDIKLPPLNSNTMIRTFKIMPRAQNSHAIVNAGFLFKNENKLIKHARIVYGNINPRFTRATNTEGLLVGKNLLTNEILKMALESLNGELLTEDLPPEPSKECRKAIALGLFYKAVLSLYADVNPRYKSGGTVLQRPLSKGTQSYETDKTLWPLNKPIPKLEALSQCSGEANYSCDVYNGPRAVHVAFVLSNVCRATILDIDATDALKVPGVVAFFSAKDVPGKNTFVSTDVPWMSLEEEIFASKNILYYGQPVGVLAAVTKRLALAAAELVKVNYKKNAAKPVLSIKDALGAPDKATRLQQVSSIEPTNKGTDIQHTFTGSFEVPSQYHFTMETQSCNVSVNENGLIVRSSTQWMDLINVAVAQSLGIDENRVLVEVPRVGGGYGGKASRSGLIACACALVAYKLNRSATLVMPLTDNMLAVGKRSAAQFDYECAVNNDGVIQYLMTTYYTDCGCTFNDSSAGALISNTMTNLYNSDTWKITGYNVLTDKPSETWCRAPGTTEAIAFCEHLMERISHSTGKDHVDVRLANIQSKHEEIRDMITGFKTDTKFNDRLAEITTFNENNAWKKRALKISIMSFPIEYSWNFPTTISVYHADGTIAISHGGIEMGQGINTKVAQVCAYALKVPLEKIIVRGSNSFVSPNAMASNGSITSDSVAHATLKACELLSMRFEPIRAKLNNPTWEEVVKQAYGKGIDLKVSYMTSPNDALEGYNVYGVCAAEVELDVLTGNHVIRRLDLLEDTGVSMSPEIDVGQIEGAFIMGLGLWTSEQLIHDKSTGRLLTDRTWTYKPPGAKDIPADFRITFRRNASNPAGVLRSKATGEPALVLAVVVTHALHDAILEARKEFGYQDNDWLFVGSPYTVENIIKAISPKIESFKLT